MWASAERPRLSTALALVAALVAALCGTETARAQDTATPAGFRVAPYLIDVTTREATVAFHLFEPLAAEVRVGRGDELSRFTSGQPSTSHFVRVIGLEPGRTYPYEVICGDGTVRTAAADPHREIRTAARPGESFTFTAYGDPRPGDNQSHRHHRLLVEQMLRVEPAFSLVLGDMVDDGSVAANWERFFEVEARLRQRSAIFAVLGDNDHAEGRGLAADYLPAAAHGPYRFEWGGVQLFGMRAWDSRGLQPESELDQQSEQVRWLGAELSRPQVQQAPFRIVFLHDPITIRRGRAAELLQRVWAPLLEQHGVDLVFASWHLYERVRQGGVTYVISGGAGAELVWMDPNPEVESQAEARRHHFIRVDVKPGALQLRAVAEDGTVIDSLTLLPRGAAAASSTAKMKRLAERLRRELVLNAQADGPELAVHLFSHDCAYCRRLLDRDLPRWAAEHQVVLRVHYYDLGLRGVYDLLTSAGADFGRQDAELPAVFVGRSVLGGQAEITAGLPAELERFRDDPQAYRSQAFAPFGQAHDTRAMRAKRFESLQLSVVLAAGLLDGVNPCAFTTIIFLLSYLTLVGSSRRRLWITGGIFTLAVFATYTLIGVAFYQLATVLMRHRALAMGVQVVLLAALLVLAVLSAVDAVRCFRGRPTEMALKLPQFLQDRIRARIRSFARNDLAAGTAAFTLGVLIAGMELACTGQVYLPIVTMIAEPRYRAAATLHLLAYNVAFILPLLAVFLLVGFGLTSQRLARAFARQVGWVKLGLAVLFVALALVVLYNLGIVS